MHGIGIARHGWARDGIVYCLFGSRRLYMDDVTAMRIRWIKYQTIAPCTILGHLNTMACRCDYTLSIFLLRKRSTMEGRPQSTDRAADLASQNEVLAADGHGLQASSMARTMGGRVKHRCKAKLR